jgi:ankyrin repeat protein
MHSTKKLNLRFIAAMTNKYNHQRMQVINIKTIGDLFTKESLNNNTSFTDKLKQLNLPNTTTISDAIKHIIENEIVEFGELLNLLWDRKYGVENTYSPFEYALEKDKHVIAEKMLEHGFDINSVGLFAYWSKTGDEYRVSAIIYAIYHVNKIHESALAFVLKKNPNLNVGYGDKQETPLLSALRHSSVASLSYAEMLLNAGADVMIKDSDGRDAIDYCEDKNLKDKILAKYKIDTLGDLIIRETRRDGKTVDELKSMNLELSTKIDRVVLKCITLDKLDLIKLIVTDFNSIFKDNVDKFYALSSCIQTSTVEILDHFVKCRADIHIRNSYEWSLLIVAARHGKLDFVNFLLDRKVNINAITCNKYTALMQAIIMEHYAIAEILINNKINISIKTIYGDDALGICKGCQPFDRSKHAQWSRILNLLTPKQTNIEITPIEPEKISEVTNVELITIEPEKITNEQKYPTTCICTNGNGKEITIPEDPIIEIYYDKSMQFDSTTMKKNLKKVRGSISVERLVDNKWVMENHNFPRCKIEIPEGFRGKCHVLPAGFIFPEETIIRFVRQCSY